MAGFDPYHVWLGIPPTEQPPNYYRLLGIPVFEDNPDVIASAADRQMAHLRSFQTGKHAAESQQLLNQVAKAKVCLLREATRQAYDVELKRRAGVAGGEVGRPAPSAIMPSRPIPVASRQPQAATAPVQPAAATMELDFSSVNLARRPIHRKRTTAFSTWFAAVGIPVLLSIGVATWSLTHEAPAERPPVELVERPIPAEKPATSQAPPPVQPPAPSPRDLLALTQENNSLPEQASVVSDPIEEQNSSAEMAEPTEVPGPVFERFDADEVKAEPTPDFEEALLPETTEGEDVDLPAAEAVPHQVVQESPTSARLPVPDEVAQAVVRQQVQSMQGAGDRQTPRAQLRLASDLMEVAAKSTDPVERYVLWQTATELGSKAGDALVMLQAIEACEQQFEFDGGEMREEAILRFAKAASTSERIRSLTAIARGEIEHAAEEQQWSRALAIANAVAQATQRPQGKEFRKQAVELRNMVRTVCEEQAKVAAAQAAVNANTADQETNQTLGEWHCFVENDWQRGLPYLSQGTDAEIRELAERDLLVIEEANAHERLALADAWWQLAEARKDEQQHAFQLRAAMWYRQCLDESLSGLERLKVQKRLEDAAAVQSRHDEWVAKRSLKSGASRPALWSDE